MKTKAQEIEQLRQFAATVEAGGYLAALLNDELLELVAARINSDIMPDILADYNTECERKDNTISDLRVENQRLQHSLDVRSQAQDALESKVEQLERALKVQAEALESFKQDYSAARDNLRMATDKVHAVEAENMRLKARLFDLMESGQ